MYGGRAAMYIALPLSSFSEWPRTQAQPLDIYGKIMFNRFNSNKCKTQAKLCIGRIKLMRNKRQVEMARVRREVAELLRANKQENARIRVESVYREQQMLQAYETLDIYLELLTVRQQMIEKKKDCPPDIFECIASLIYAAPRMDFPELNAIRTLLGHKYGKEFVERASSDESCRQWQVNDNLIKCLAIGAPDPETKLSLLSDIAQEHGVEWDSNRAHQEMITGKGYVGSGGSVPGTPATPPSGGFGDGGGNYAAGVNGNLAFTGQQPVIGSLNQQPVAPPPAAIQSKLKNLLNKGPSPTFVEQSGGNYQSAEWNDASSAASAAREFSHRAQNAADAAQRYASTPIPGEQFRQDMGSRHGTSPPPFQDGTGQKPNYPNIAMSDSQPPEYTPMTSSLQGQPGNNSQQQAGQYRQRTDEEIQRAYDAAVGPPVKKSGPPSAPPADHQPAAQGPGAPTPSKGEEEDLLARFAALKKL